VRTSGSTGKDYLFWPKVALFMLGGTIDGLIGIGYDYVRSKRQIR
jgi:hypothetical protein